MGLFLTIGIVWVVYQIIGNINIAIVSKKPKAKIQLFKSSDINAA